MKTRELALLSSICDFNMGQSPDSSSYNQERIGLPFFQGNADFGELHPTIKYWCSNPLKTARINDVLISVRAPIGALNIADDTCCIGRGLAALTAKENKCLSKYLYYALKSKTNDIIANGTGSTFKAITKKTLENILIPITTIDNQRKVVLVLDKIKELIKHRRKQLNSLDLMVKSHFVEMFGDPVTNNKGFPLVHMKECCLINPKKYEDKRLIGKMKVSFIPMAAVSEKGEIILSEIRSYDEVKNGFTYFAENDVLFAKITPCMENGKGAIMKGLVNGIGFGSTEFHVLRPIENISTPYWLYQITMFDKFRQNAAKNMTGSAGQRRVPVSYLENYIIGLPHFDLQEQFAEFVQQVDKTKFVMQKGLEKLELTYKALMQQYFG